MPIVRVNGAAARVTGVTTCAVSWTGVTAGNAVIISIGCTSASTPTFTVSDSLGNTFTSAVRNTATRTTEIEYVLNLPTGTSGTYTVTVTSSVSTNFFAAADEVSGLDSGGQPDSSSTTSNAATTTHNAAASGQLDTVAADCFLMAVYASGSDLGGGTVSSSPSAWTKEYDNSGGGGRFVQSVIVSAVQTDNRCVMTSVNTINTGACVAAFKMAAGGTSVSVTDSGAGSDAAPTIACDLAATDTGAASDSLSCTASVPVSDSGSGSDSLSCSVSVSVTETGTGTEALNVEALIGAITDSGVGSDVIAQITQGVFVSLADSGTAVDSIASLEVALSIPDTSAGLESIAALSVAVGAIADACSGVDGVTVAASGGGRVATLTFTARSKSSTFSPVAKSTEFDPNL